MEFRNFNTETDWFFFEIAENESYIATNNGSSISNDLLQQRRKNMESFIQDPSFFVKMLTKDEKTFGIIITGIQNINGDNYGFLYNIYISPQYRKNGYGTLAIEKAIEFCKQKQCLKINLNVGNDNQNAIKIYNKLNFKSTNIAMELPLR